MNHPDLIAQSEEAWGAPLPDWVRALAVACQRASQAAVAKELGRSGAVVSQVLRPKTARLALAVKARSPEHNMWTAMRQLKSFSPRELAAHASTEDTPVTLEVAQDYCRALLGAGYLVATRKAVPGKQLAIYRLTRNTGPRPPREKRVRAVVDDNTETVIVIGGGQ